MSGLAGFLLARIAEDEQAAGEYQEMLDARQRELQAMWARGASPAIALYDFSLPGGAGDPARVLAECDAKRRIAEALAALQDLRYDEPVHARGTTAAYVNGVNFAAKLLALPYADHPDYDEAWRP